MRTFICPRCGEWIEESHPDFPRCVFCGERLIRCGLCQAFPGNGQACQRAKGSPIVYASTSLDCPSFLPRFVAQRRHPLLTSSGRWQLVASLTFTFSVLLVAVLSRPVPSRVLLSAVAPSQVALGRTVEVRLLVRSEVGQPIRLRLDRRLLTDFQLVTINPLPSRVNAFGTFYEFVLPTARDPQPVSVRFKSTRVGEYAMQVTVLTAPHRKAEWQAKIKVVKQPPAPRLPKGLRVIAMLPRR